MRHSRHSVEEGAEAGVEEEAEEVEEEAEEGVTEEADIWEEAAMGEGVEEEEADMEEVTDMGVATEEAMGVAIEACTAEAVAGAGAPGFPHSTMSSK